jgi:citronellyl-CoA dehydrogenase
VVRRARPRSRPMIETHEHRQLRETARRVIEAHVNPFVDEWEAAGMFPAREVFRRFGEAGLLGITKPVAYGGLGLDYTYEFAFAEELGHIKCGGVSMAIGVQTDMATPALAKHGSDALRREWLAPAIAGDAVGCIGVTEEGAGSDVASLRTFARRDGGDYVITGSKMFITNGVQADFMCMLANTSQEGGPHRNKSLIVVPMKAKGVTVLRKLDKLGMRSSDTAQLYFDEVRVPAANRIGEEGKGFVYQMEQFQEERLIAACKGITALEDVIQETVDYTSERKAFGGRLIDNQYIQFKLAELLTEVQALRGLTHMAVEKYAAGEDVTMLASMAKYKVGTLATRVPSECLQFWGGQGYMEESRIARMYRDLRLSGIGGGANEIMLRIIARRAGMGGRANPPG